LNMAPLPQRVHSASTLQNNGTPAWKPSLAAIGAPAWKTRQPDPALWAVISEEWEAPAPSGWTGSFQKATPSGAWKPSLPARNVLTAANANVLDLEFHRQGRLEKNTSKADPDRDTAQCTGAEISKEQEATSAPRLVLRADDSWISDLLSSFQMPMHPELRFVGVGCHVLFCNVPSRQCLIVLMTRVRSSSRQRVPHSKWSNVFVLQLAL